MKRLGLRLANGNSLCLLAAVCTVVWYLSDWNGKTPLQRTMGVCLLGCFLLLFGAACLATRQCRRWKGIVAAGCAAALVFFLAFDFRTVRVKDLPGWDPAASVSGVSFWVEGENGVTDLRWTPGGDGWKTEQTGDIIAVSGGDGAGFRAALEEVRLRNHWWFGGEQPENITTFHVNFSDGRDVDFYLGRDGWSISPPEGDWLPGTWYVDQSLFELLLDAIRPVINERLPARGLWKW